MLTACFSTSSSDAAELALALLFSSGILSARTRGPKTGDGERWTGARVVALVPRCAPQLLLRRHNVRYALRRHRASRQFSAYCRGHTDPDGGGDCETWHQERGPTVSWTSVLAPACLSVCAWRSVTDMSLLNANASSLIRSKGMRSKRGGYCRCFRAESCTTRGLTVNWQTVPF
ncbi:hypothetical protein C8Q77DRAFT_219622 [Trametes polyzona]|nr:hypothetical protein C8Q77DRAFT_219622 [Trametes polyzona]